MAKCEHCNVDPAEIQAGADARVKQVIEKNKAITEELRRASTELATARETLQTLQAEREAASLSAAEQAGGWAFDDRGRKAARWAYEDAIDGVAEAERPSFSDWLKSEAAAKDPLLGAYRKPAQAAPAPNATPRPPAAPPRAETPPAPARRTPQQIAAAIDEIMAGAGSLAEKQAKLAALKGEARQDVTTGA